MFTFNKSAKSNSSLKQMIFYKLKNKFSSSREFSKGPRIIYNIYVKRKFTIFDLRKILYAYIYTRQWGGLLILQNRNHKLLDVNIIFLKFHKYSKS